MAQTLKFLRSVLQMPNRRSTRLMNRRHAPTPEPVKQNRGRGGNNHGHGRGRGRGRGGIPFNLENTPPPEENLPPPPPPKPGRSDGTTDPTSCSSC